MKPRLHHVHVPARAGILFLLVALLSAVPAESAQPTAPHLTIRQPIGSNEWVRLNSSFHSNAVLSLEASTNVINWQPIATLHDALFSYPDAAAPGHPHRLYRLQATERSRTNDWKNQIWFPEEPFRSRDGDSLRFVKFAILLNDPTRVHYQHSTNYPFHFDFATQRLTPFLGMDRVSFDAISLHRTNQQVVLGAVLYPPRSTFVEYGVQFVGLDPYTPDEIAGWFRLVQATLFATNGAGAVYMPTFEQSEMARTNAEAFAARGIPLGSIERWLPGNRVYAPGWALGRLKFFPAAEIDAAFADGRLRPEDILLTDGVPAETPLVAGIISLTPSTPNSHTAILAQSFGIPFVHLPDVADQVRVQALVGRKVILRATVQFNEALIKVVDVEGALPAPLEAELLALKRPAPIQFTPKQSYGAISAPTQGLTPSDIRYFGGKAANFSLLRRSIPTNSPEAIAFSFDLWDAFMDQTLPGGGTLRAEIAARLAPYTSYPPDITAMKAALAGIRSLITGTARFTVAQQQTITNLLGNQFDPQRKIRFRSSTNVEDSENFTGAGLYDSYSGCLLDDLDGDTSGPSRCDPDESGERGVFRAIQRVYASFYNDNAYLERLRHGVDETKVGMGVLVHHSFPDEVELANGVATIDFRYTTQFSSLSGDLVTQLGAESVTNPDGTAVPEVVDAFRSGNITGISLQQQSSRVPLGAFVMNWESDYRGFIGLFKTVADTFRQFYPAKNRFYLDFEYKKDANLGLVVKQVREIPNPQTTNRAAAYLINEPVSWSVAQREAGDVFGNHRLKSQWLLQAANMKLTPSNLAQGVYTQGTLNYPDNGVVQSLGGPLNTWPNASNAPSGAINYWTTGNGPTRRHWQLNTALITNVAGATPPLFTQNDFETSLSVNYATPVPTINESGQLSMTTNEIAFLEPLRTLRPVDILKQRRATKAGVVDIQIEFYWPNEPPTAAGYTAPLVTFRETRITGLTTQPIVLTNYYSQTYRPGHHNFTESFIFEPRLEPGLPAATLTELVAANIQFVHVHLGFLEPTINILGLDQKVRKL